LMRRHYFKPRHSPPLATRIPRPKWRC
jgi:hypothetical protein